MAIYTVRIISPFARRYLGSSVTRCFFSRSTGWLFLTMASDGPVDALGRQCKAMAKAKAKAAVKFDDFIVAYSAELLASEAAVRLREEHRNVVAQTEMENVSVAAPSPWDDMHDIV